MGSAQQLSGTKTHRHMQPDLGALRCAVLCFAPALLIEPGTSIVPRVEPLPVPRIVLPGLHRRLFAGLLGSLGLHLSAQLVPVEVAAVVLASALCKIGLKLL